MRKYILLGAVLVPLGLVASGYALNGGKAESAKGAAPNVAKSKITKVTVYPNAALVTREVEVPAGQGLVELVVPDLPVRIVNSSLYSEGTDKLRVLTTRFRQQPVQEDTREDVRKIEDELDKIRLSVQKLQKDMETVRANLKTLDGLERFTAVTTVSSTEKGGLNGDTVITLAKYVMEQRAEKMKEDVSIQQQIEKHAEQAKFLARKLNDLTAGSTRIERDAVIVIDREKNAAGTVRLNYLVSNVSWSPQYKLRAGKTSEPVQVDYLAAVMQQSGEDWRGVDLSFSTAQPMLNAAPPELARLEVSVVARASLPPMPGGVPGQPMPPGMSLQPVAPQAAPMELAQKAIQLRGQFDDAVKNKDVTNALKFLNEAAAYEQTRELQRTREEILADNRKQGGQGGATANEGPSVTYHLKSRMTVPSRKDDQILEVAKIKLDPKFYYKAVPVLTRHVYRQADVTNKSEFVFLPGEATMYQGTDFVGRMRMPLVAIGEEFTCGFGVDPQVQVQREMMDMQRSTQGGNQVLNYKYRILVSSFKNEPVALQVWDRLPHAQTETAGITLVKATPEVSKDELYEREARTQNLLRWDLTVEPGRNGVNAVPINYEFRLELDRNMAISGLLSR